jgi:hypothetical protein
LQGAPGRQGEDGPSIKGPTAPLSRYKVGNDDDTQYIYTKWEIGSVCIAYGSFVDGRVADGGFALTLTNNRFVGTFRLKDLVYGTDNEVVVNVQRPPSGTYATIYTSRQLAIGHEGRLYATFMSPAREHTPSVVETPPRSYLFPQVDNSPADGDSLQLVSSGGVATAYCALIDKLAQYKGLSAAQVAMMKALYGA